MRRWEYKVTSLDLANNESKQIKTIEQKLNELGIAGWELVHAREGNNWNLIVTLKREALGGAQDENRR